MSNTPVFLVGFMGSGKTTWGKKLANALGLPFIDLDHEIVSEIGMSIPEYFEQFGESRFREKEQEILLNQKGKSAIISTGGGTPCFYDNMDWLLENGTVIYLQHSPRSLWNRLSNSDIRKRPSLNGLQGESLLHFIEKKLAQRNPYYIRAQIIIDQINTPLEELVSLVENRI